MQVPFDQFVDIALILFFGKRYSSTEMGLSEPFALPRALVIDIVI
jgi:hypothetical protein